MNILVLAVSSANEDESCIPFYLLEEHGISHLERIYENVSCLNPKTIIYVFSSKEVKKYGLDRIVKLLGENTITVSANDKTSGAVCSALLAVEHVNNDNELLILNANEVLSFKFQDVLEQFRDKHYDAGVPVFSSLNPQYSYVLLNENENVIEAAEKQVISRNATAGFYWYKQGKTFVEMAMKMILKKACTNEVFYICPVFNELILNNGKVGIWRFPNSQYLPLKNSRQIMKGEYI